MKRVRTPEDTLNILTPYMLKAQITRVADISNLDDICRDIYVLSAIRPASKSLSVSMGKARDKLSAKCAAIAESLEVFYAEEAKPHLKNICERDLIKSAYVINTSLFQKGKCKFDPEYRLSWGQVYELRTNEKAYIPFHLISLNSGILENQLFGSNSDGLASGNTEEEALIMSLFEQIERASINKKKSKIKIDFKPIIESYHINENIKLDVFSYPNVYEIPVIGVEIYNKYQIGNQNIYRGYGSSETYTRALCRAIEEAIQTKIGLISGMRDDLREEHYSTRQLSLNDNISYLEMLPYKEFSYDNRRIINYLIDSIYHCGHKVFVYKYLNSDFFVVKTFITDDKNNLL